MGTTANHTIAVDGKVVAPLSTPPTLEALALIPAWNEARTIMSVVTGVRKHLPVFVVDDGSTDDTAAAAQEAGAVVIRHECNQGKGAALKTGFVWAMERGFEAIVTIDADAQHDPKEIPLLLAAWRKHPNTLIIGKRNFKHMPWLRRWANMLATRLLSLALGVPLSDNQSGYRILPRSLIEKMQLSATRYEMEVEVLWEARRLGVPIVWVPIRTIYHPGRKSGFRPFFDTLRFLRMVCRIGRLRVKTHTDRKRII